MHRIGSIAAVLLLALAGCADNGQVQEEPTLTVDEEVVVSATTGAIRGVVVDTTIVPIPEADVLLVGKGLETRTNQNGEFVFSDLDPGAYFIKVSKPGYSAVQQSTEVEAGVERPPVVRVLIEPDPSSAPVAFERKWEGLIQCSLRFVVNAIALCSAYGGLGDDFAERYTDLDAPPTFVQSEMLWDNTQPLGDSLKLQYTDDNSGLDNYAISQGPSPRIISTDNATLENKHFDNVGLYVRVFTGDYEGTGLSLTLQQKFTVYSSFFYNYAPPEGWTFIDDGSIPPP